MNQDMMQQFAAFQQFQAMMAASGSAPVATPPKADKPVKAKGKVKTKPAAKPKASKPVIEPARTVEGESLTVGKPGNSLKVTVGQPGRSSGKQSMIFHLPKAGRRGVLTMYPAEWDLLMAHREEIEAFYAEQVG